MKKYIKGGQAKADKSGQGKFWNLSSLRVDCALIIFGHLVLLHPLPVARKSREKFHVIRQQGLGFAPLDDLGFRDMVPDLEQNQKFPIENREGGQVNDLKVVW